jgi:hypothetical protein
MQDPDDAVAETAADGPPPIPALGPQAAKTSLSAFPPPVVEEGDRCPACLGPFGGRFGREPDRCGTCGVYIRKCAHGTRFEYFVDRRCPKCEDEDAEAADAAARELVARRTTHLAHSDHLPGGECPACRTMIDDLETRMAKATATITSRRPPSESESDEEYKRCGRMHPPDIDCSLCRKMLPHMVKKRKEEEAYLLMKQKNHDGSLCRKMLPCMVKKEEEEEAHLLRKPDEEKDGDGSVESVSERLRPLCPVCSVLLVPARLMWVYAEEDGWRPARPRDSVHVLRCPRCPLSAVRVSSDGDGDGDRYIVAI